MSIVRSSLRQQAVVMLRERLLNGGLAAGERVNESALAADLGVSQTPVREALLTLEREGFLTSQPGRGFAVRPLSADEVRENYPILGHLEAFALRSSGVPSAATLTALDGLNEAMRACAGDPERLHALDRDWHGRLMAHVTNQRLLELIESVRISVDRYEYAYFRSEGRALDSTGRHGDVLACLRVEDMDGAASALERNWTESLEPLVAWLEPRDD